MNTVKANGWNISDLLEIDDPELERMFHAGSPAYTDRRMEEFLDPATQIGNCWRTPNHVSRQVLSDEYRATHPDGYGKSQFYYHLKQNLRCEEGCYGCTGQHLQTGEKLMWTLPVTSLKHVDAETGEIVKVEVFVARGLTATIPMWYVYLRRRRRTFMPYDVWNIWAVYLPYRLPDNLKSAVISNDRHEPKLNKALDTGNYYHFVVLPCDPASPTEGSGRGPARITYNRVYARLV